MPNFGVYIKPISMLRTVVDMHRTERVFEAPNLSAARRMLREAFPDGVCLVSDWEIEPKTLRQIPAGEA